MKDSFRELSNGTELVIGKKIEKELVVKIEELEDFKLALDQSSIVAITDSQGIITYVNETFCEISKYSKDELVGSNHRIINSGYHSKRFFRDMWNKIRNGQIWTGEIKNRAKDGAYYWVKTTIVPFMDKDQTPYQYISIRQDITKQKEIEEQILYNAYHDELTGLRNRRCFNSEMNQWINEKMENREMALLFLDLNRLKYINDALGHSVGDQILISVSKRLVHFLQGNAENVELYRFGGDEFIIIIKNKPLQRVKEIVAEITDLFSQPFFVNDERLYLTASMGISLFPRDGKEIESLVKKADSAMYVAKKNGTNSIQFYSHEMYEFMKKTVSMERKLRHAIEEKSFTLHYQPQVDISTNKIVGVEALIRWKHPKSGYISPAEFIPLAEETGLIRPITEWVLETACKQWNEWHNSGVPPVRIGVNISPFMFREGLVALVKRVVKETNIPPCYLELEITESIMQNPELNIQILKELKGLGVRISIDDFGTGYSSLAYLKHFPIDCLKIDRSFIEEIQEDNGIIVKTIIDMASHLNVSVIAEGIEDEEQLAFLTQLNCAEGQGYFFSRPLSSLDIVEILEKGWVI